MGPCFSNFPRDGEDRSFQLRNKPSRAACSYGKKSQQERNEPRPASGNLTDYFLDVVWDVTGALADACYDAMKEAGQYISTASTARDMIKIAEWLNEDGVLCYSGWSYGTVLGVYTATIFT
jgi:hypothetical protein